MRHQGLGKSVMRDVPSYARCLLVVRHRVALARLELTRQHMLLESSGPVQMPTLLQQVSGILLKVLI